MATNKAYLIELTIALASLNGFDDFAAYLGKMDNTRGKRMSKLFGYLRKHYKDLEEETACYFVLGKRDITLPSWRKLRNDLAIVLEKYVLTEKMYQEEALRLRAKLELSRDLHLENIFAKTEKKLGKITILDEKRLYEFKEKVAYVRYFKEKAGFSPEAGS